MAAAAHNPTFAKKAGIPVGVAKEFNAADKGRKFAEGGTMKKLPPFMGKETPSEEKKEMKVKKASPAMYKEGEKREGVHGKSGMKNMPKYAKGGMVDGCATKGKTRGKMV
jgi:hypothetical protein